MSDHDALHDAAPRVIDLRNPWLAGFLAWLVPGLGHAYQRRWAKAAIYVVCILGTYCYGLWLGDGRVVYASMHAEDFRLLPLVCQSGVGTPALLVVVQEVRAGRDDRRAPPPLWGGLFAAPEVRGNDQNGAPDELDKLHFRLHRYFELGTVFTMIAGLLNLLAVYDAFAGPAGAEELPPEEKQPPGGGGK